MIENVLVLNGVNLNMLGVREPELYGNRTYFDLEKYVKAAAERFNLCVEIEQSNYEGRLVELIQNATRRYDAIVINAGAYTHTSIAILDALKAVGLPTVEVHLTDISSREPFRKLSYVGMYAEKSFIGLGFEGYAKALEYLANRP